MRMLIEFLRLLQLLVFIRIILTWIMPGSVPPLIRPVTDRIDAVLKRFQVLVPMGPAYIDLGPLLLMLLLEAITRVLVGMM